MFLYTEDRGSQFLPSPLPFKGAVPERIAPLIPGFRLTEFCGKGGISEVWKGVDRKGKSYAFRIVYKKKGKGISWKKDMRSNLFYMKNVPPHRNLLPILEWGEKREFSYSVMLLADNLFPGGKYVADTLANRLKHPAFFSFTAQRIFSLMLSLAEGGDFLHQNGLAHNDLKPENILFVKGIPLLTDFGLAGPLGEKTQGGTASYLPEWENAPGRERDLYAAGKILYTLFTGNDPSQYPLLPEKFFFSPALAGFFNDMVFFCCSPGNGNTFAAFKERLREGERVFLQEAGN